MYAGTMANKLRHNFLKLNESEIWSLITPYEWYDPISHSGMVEESDKEKILLNAQEMEDK